MAKDVGRRSRERAAPSLPPDCKEITADHQKGLKKRHTKPTERYLPSNLFRWCSELRQSCRLTPFPALSQGPSPQHLQRPLGKAPMHGTFSEEDLLLACGQR